MFIVAREEDIDSALIMELGVHVNAIIIHNISAEEFDRRNDFNKLYATQYSLLLG